MKLSSKNQPNSSVSPRWGEAAAERTIDLDLYLANPSAYGRSNSRARVIVPGGTARRRVQRPHSKGQALLIIALMMTVLILFVGLGVDVGNLMGRRAKLQSAVDASALSAAQLLNGTIVTTTVQTKAYQLLEANGILSATIATKTVNVNSTLRQVQVKVVQHVDTFFMRIIPLWRTVDVSAEATADLNAFAEINIKPYGFLGVVNELNISIWGPNSWRRGGDAYSPDYISGNTPNTQGSELPYGYLYRIDVPPGFSDDHLIVQIFDPDTYNNPTPAPTVYLSPTPVTSCSGNPVICVTSTPLPTPTYYADDGRYTYDTGTGARYNTYLNLGAYPLTATPIPAVFKNTRRVAFWRVDEFRRYRTDCDIDPGSCGGNANTWDDTWANTTTYTLWHFDPRINSAFADPTTLSDKSDHSYVAQYTVAADSRTDLAWYQPPGFDVTLNDSTCGGDCYEKEADGSYYFYMYVSTSAGSSENNFDFRVGPKDGVSNGNATNYDCSTLPLAAHSYCKANEQYFQQSTSLSPIADWDAGGAYIFAKRAMPLNLDSGVNYPMLFTQLSEKAAGQTLAVKHFDQDCSGTNGCGNAGTGILQYQMQRCVIVNTQTACPDGGNCEPCEDTNSDGCFGDVGTGWVGPNNAWYCPGPDQCTGWTAPQQPERVSIPVEGTLAYNTFFGPNGQCSSSWFRLERNPSGSQDTTVWEMPYARPRLIK